MGATLETAPLEGDGSLEARILHEHGIRETDAAYLDARGDQDAVCTDHSVHPGIDHGTPCHHRGDELLG
jgi:hypothetical protein